MFRIALAFVCASCLVSAAETSFENKFPHSFSLEKHTETPQSSDFKKFRSWILSQDPSAGKSALLNSTLISVHYPFSPTIIWYKARMKTADFDNLLNQTFLSPSVTINTAQGNYNYTPDNAFWVDFANGEHFGGGFRSRGNVQEERMFFEFPQLANLAYVLRNNKTILPMTKKGAAEPFLIVSMLRKSDVSKVPYGRDLDETSPKTVIRDVIHLKAPYTSANIIGLAALDYSKKHSSKYSLDNLKYMLQAAFLGDAAALQYNGPTNLIIHTGKWGAGAFKNSVKMVTAIQILAAEMAFTGGIIPLLVFHGIDPTLLDPIQQEITQKLHAGETALSLLKTFYKRQESDSTWRPQGAN